MANPALMTNPAANRFPAPRPDVLAGLVAMVAGVAGVLHMLLSWTADAPQSGLNEATGWQLFTLAKGSAAGQVGLAVAAYAMLAVAVIGGAFILLGLAMLTPINHRPLGVAGLALSLIAVIGEVWWLAKAGQVTGTTLGELFANAGPGWYLFLITGPLGLLGSAKALTTG